MSNNKIFVSYRRQDASGEAGRLVDHLQEVFGDSSVFLDVETIEAGLDFVQAINKALNSCKVLIAMIGPHWANIKDPEGNPRLFKEDDFIRIEIAAALERDIRVIPVLVNGASMPTTDQLPENLQALTRRHAQELSSSRWKYDCEQLTEVLKKIVGYQEVPPPKPKPQPTPPIRKQKSWLEKNYLWILGAFVILLILANLGSGDDYKNGGGGYEPEPRPIVDGSEGEIQPSNDPPPYTPPGNTNEFMDVSGYWLLQDKDGNQSALFFTQEAEEVSFIEYNLFDMEIGRGSGYLDGNSLNTDYYNSILGISGEFKLSSANKGTSWTGRANFPSLGTYNQITLTRD